MDSCAVSRMVGNEAIRLKRGHWATTSKIYHLDTSISTTRMVSKIVLPSEVSCECLGRKVELLLRRRLALLGGCTNKRQLSLGAAVIALSSETEQLQVERLICSVYYA
jgi:hypothetical protein